MEEEDGQSDDSSGSETELQTRVTELRAAIVENPYQYEYHVELVGLLRQLGDLDGARNARNAMSETFPLTEELWLEWIQDEMPLVSIPEASMELRQLFDRATEDYLSVEIWLQYAQFALDKMSSMPEGLAFPRDIFERAIVKCGLHISKAGELWDMYRGFETALLKSLQQMQHKSPEDETLKTQVEAQYERVEKLFKRQLAVPLIGMEETLKQYHQFSDTSPTKDNLPSYNLALKRLGTLMPFEEELASSSPPSLTCYHSYLRHVRTAKEDPMFVNTLYQRAVADHCLQVELWKDYLTFLNSSFPGVSSVLLPPHRQAVRNCPWVSELWVTSGIAMERAGAGETETVAAFEKGLTSGNFSSAEDNLQVWTAYLDYLRRRVRLPDNQEVEGDTPELVGLRKTFKRARDTLETEFGRHGDPTDSLSLYQARLEAHRYGNLEESRFLWDDIMTRHGREAKYWIQYADMERQYGDSEKCRKILILAVNSASDDPELVMKTLLQFEREEGDLASYEAAREKCSSQMKRVEQRREKAAEKEAQQKEGRKKAGKKSGVSTDTSRKGKSPWQQKQQKAGEKRSRGQKGHGFYEEVNQPKRQKVEDAAQPHVTMETDASPRQPEAPPTSVAVAMDATPGVSTETKTSIAEPPGRPVKSREGEGEGEGEEEKGKRTVFVSNLKMSITKEDVEEAFSQCGEMSEVRLVKSQSRGKANAYAYVEFTSTDSVAKALQLEHTELKGRIMYVAMHREKGSKSDTKPTTSTFHQGDNKATVFVTNIQHNADEETLKQLFEKCGEVKEVRLVRNKDGRPKGFAYIEFVNESSAGSAVLQLDNHPLGMKSLKVSISNPPKRKGEGESTKRTGGQAVQSADGAAQGKSRDKGGFLKPSFIPARVKAQEQADAPRRKANIGLVPRVLVKQARGKSEGGDGGEGGRGGEGEGKEGEGAEKMDEGQAKAAPPQKMSNDDFRSLFNKS